MNSKLKFGVFVSMYGTLIKDAKIDPEPSFQHIRQTVELAEYFNLHSIWVTDHILNPKLTEKDPAWEAWTTLAAIAAISSKTKLGPIVLCQAFRNPALLAKMAATLDHISDGRLMLGLGGGNHLREFQAYGMTWDEHDRLVERGIEQMQLIKQLWTEDDVNFNGEYFQITGGIVEPKPLQKPYPPIVWGGTSQKSQQAAAENADIWFMKDSTVEQVKENIASFNKYLQGRKLEIGMGLMLIPGETDNSAFEKLVKIVGGNEKNAQEISNISLVGSPQTIAQKIADYERAGLNYLLLKPVPTIGGLVDFGESILPLL